MAKRKTHRRSRNQMSTLHQHVPHWVAYGALVALFLAAVIMTRRAVGLY